MFVIELNEKNREKINERINPTEVDTITLDTYQAAHSTWYVVTGYVNRKGKLSRFTVLPYFVLEHYYDFNKTVARNDWDQAVRK